jgi:hypothetical protein
MNFDKMDIKGSEDFGDFLKSLKFLNIIDREDNGNEKSETTMPAREDLQKRFRRVLESIEAEWTPGTLDFCRGARPDIYGMVVASIGRIEMMISQNSNGDMFEKALREMEMACRSAMQVRMELEKEPSEKSVVNEKQSEMWGGQHGL